MTTVRLTGGAYTAHSLVAAAQRQVNLFTEPVPEGSGEPSPTALYPTPGLRLLTTLPAGPIRGIHTTTSGPVYVVAGSGVYAVAANWTYTLLGMITAGLTTPVSMSDNGLTMIIVDGSPNGWQVTLAGNAFAPIVNAAATGSEVAYTLNGVPPSGATTAVVTAGVGEGLVGDTFNIAGIFQTLTPTQLQVFTLTTAFAGGDGTITFSPALVYATDGAPATNAALTFTSAVSNFSGADRIDYLDTFFVANVPGTPQFQASLSLSVTFDPLYFANKTAYSDLLVALIVSKREIWLIGTETTEVWYDTGGDGTIAGSFPFQSMPGVFIDRGCCAKYSVCETDNAVYWLSADRYGQGIVLQGAGYAATRVSTYAIEAELATYPTLTDAIGYAYQLSGHVYYVLSFPSADKTWAYDITTKLWHELVWIDANGSEHRHRAVCATAGYATVIAGDWETGSLYALDPSVYTDVGNPIKRLRSFPHMLAEGKRVMYRQFLCDVECGNPGGDVAVLAPPRPFVREDGTGLLLREDGTPLLREQDVLNYAGGLISLCWSDDRGHRFGNPITQTIGASGVYLTSVQFQRLGMARDRVFEISWSLPTATILQGAWVDLSPAQS